WSKIFSSSEFLIFWTRYLTIIKSHLMKKNSFLPGMCPHKMEQQCAHPPAIEAEVAAMENYYIKKLENAGFELHFVLFCAFIPPRKRITCICKEDKRWAFGRCVYA